MASGTGQPWLTPRSKQQAVADGQHEFQLNRPGGLDLESFSQLHKFSYAIVWRPVWGGGTQRDGCFVQLDGEDRPERLKVDHHKSFGDFALASSEFQFIAEINSSHAILAGRSRMDMVRFGSGGTDVSIPGSMKMVLNQSLSEILISFAKQGPFCW